MIQSIETVSEAIPVYVELELTPTAFAVGFGPLEDRLSLIREMIAGVDDATPAGQRYLMNKVLVLLRREALRPDARFTAPQGQAVNRSLGEIEYEAARLAPDPIMFERRAQILVDLFSFV